MRSLSLLTRLVLLVSLVLATVPVGATRTVCVLGSGKAVQTVARCDMPCCAGPHAEGTPPKRSCCAPKRAATVAPVASRGDRCLWLGKPCRCETRLVAGTTSRVVTLDAKAVVPVEHPAAVLSARVVKVACPTLDLWVPGIVGLDAGPPPKPETSSRQPRAPPSSSVL